MNFSVLFRKEMTEQWKTYKLLIVGVLLLLFGLTTPLLLKFLPEILKASGEQIPLELPAFAGADAVQSYIGNLGQIGLLIAVLVSMGAIAQERERRTAVMTLSKPAGFGSFVTAKLAALAVNFGLGLTLGALGCYIYTVVLLGPFDFGLFVVINLLAALYMLVCISVTLMYSSLFRNQIAAGGMALLTLIILAVVSSIPLIGQYLPNALMNNATTLAKGGPVPGSLYVVLFVSAIFVAGTVVIGWQSLKKREL